MTLEELADKLQNELHFFGSELEAVCWELYEYAKWGKNRVPKPKGLVSTQDFLDRENSLDNLISIIDELDGDLDEEIDIEELKKNIGL